VSAAGTARAALAVLARHPLPAYLAALLATAVNTVPDVVRQLLVYDSPSVAAALLVDVVGLATALLGAELRTRVFERGAIRVAAAALIEPGAPEKRSNPATRV